MCSFIIIAYPGAGSQHIIVYPGAGSQHIIVYPGVGSQHIIVYGVGSLQDIKKVSRLPQIPEYQNQIYMDRATNVIIGPFK